MGTILKALAWLWNVLAWPVVLGVIVLVGIAIVYIWQWDRIYHP